ncbi:DUF4153 domain-containing protein [Brevundimonas sp.]|uniref:DUF4153 domain-containing protein n=1 Tax=Brevundimonas sp. TaxID=1871086 RepID=UPI0025BD89EC|nr:DUF4153 domain-containing protein [Brevundimonas sp.]
MTETTQNTVHDTGRAGLKGENRLFAARVGIGLIQGLLLYALYRAADGKAWPSTEPELFGGLALAVGFAPVAALAGVGRLRWPALAIWIGVAGLVLFLLGWHDVARRVLGDYDQAPFLKFPVMAFAAAALFIAHHLLTPAVRARRWLVDYHQYFDVAWKAGVQLALSLGFTGAFWILLQLGAALFDLIGLKFLTDLVRSAWFAMPVTCTAFAIAVQLTDVRDGLIRGVRTVALMLLSWLLLVITVLAAGFLAALPFTGLEPLWATRSATAMILAATAALIILINTAYQDGEPDNLPPLVLRIATRVASVLVAPLVVLAIWGLSLRIGQHGLTQDRIIAAACAFIGVVYAVGYLFAAVRPGAWMKPLERTNVVAAVLSVLTILALFSPLLDPTRLSVSDQVARLERGKVKAADFDYGFLRFDSGKAGRAALDRLAASTDAETARLAREAKASDNRSAYSPDETRELARQVKIEPIAGQTLPPDFMAQIQSQPDLALNCRSDEACVLRMTDLDGDGRQDVLLANGAVILAFTQGEDGRWRQRARYNATCGGAPPIDLKAALKAGVETAPMRLPDLIVNGRRLQFWPETRCDAEAAR